MTKGEIAEYLMALDYLIQAQLAAGHSTSSTTLRTEYNKYWKLLKEKINSGE